MSYIVQHDTHKIIWVDAHFTHFGFAYHCPECNSHETMFTTLLYNYDEASNRDIGGWICMDCGHIFMPEQEE